MIFDLDGTVIDTEGEWEGTFRQVWEEYSGQKIIDKKWIHEPGIGLTANWKKLVKDQEMVERLVKRTLEVFNSQVREDGDVQMREGVIEAVDRVKQLGWMTALCTSSIWTTVENELEQLGLYLAFDVTTTGEEVLAPKPDPEIYMLTAQKLGVDFSQCLVVEDSVSGVEAGAAAGMEVIGVVSEYNDAGKLVKAGATFTVNDIRDIVAIFNEIKGKEQVISSDEEG